MRDWTGTRIREDAWRVPCRYCGAPPGEGCISQDGEARPIDAFPAHISRIKDAEKTSNTSLKGVQP